MTPDHVLLSLDQCDPFAVLVARLCIGFYDVPDAARVLNIHSDKIASDTYEKGVKVADMLRDFVDMEPTDPRWLAIVEAAK